MTHPLTSLFDAVDGSHPTASHFLLLAIPGRSGVPVDASASPLIRDIENSGPLSEELRRLGFWKQLSHVRRRGGVKFWLQPTSYLQ
jgi:hypothetical protein